LGLERLGDTLSEHGALHLLVLEERGGLHEVVDLQAGRTQRGKITAQDKRQCMHKRTEGQDTAAEANHVHKKSTQSEKVPR
jgi:hypothetical protein